jgi:threonine dehydrogenase-like Zn-dependent dehydrogenase
MKAALDSGKISNQSGGNIMKDVMIAAVFEKEGVLQVNQVTTPTIKKDTDVLLKVDAVSICGSDLKILEVPPAHPAKEGVIMGHEYVGEVVECGSAVTTLTSGDKVAIEPNIPCGTCIYCREGMTHMCDSLETLGETLDGGFAEYNIAPENQLHKLPVDAPPEETVFIEPLSCVVGAFEKMMVQPSDLAVVAGAGPLGLLFTQCLKAWGANVIVTEPSPERQTYARHCGADEVVGQRIEDLLKVVRRYSPIGAEIVVDTVGSLMVEFLPLLRRYGKLVLFGINEHAEAKIHQYDITRNNLQILGSFIGSGVFPRAIEIIKNKKIDVTKLMSHKFPLSEINTGVDLLRKREAVKVVLTP